MLMKILRYEMKRIWLGRLFPIMLICNCVYAFIWMRQNGIAGIGGTAPFSKFTYLAYCGAMLPPALLTLLLQQANYCSAKQQKADILPLASPYTPSAFTLIRILALTCCFLVIFLLEFAVYAQPCLQYFGKTEVLNDWLIGLLHMLPAVILTISAGGLIGKLNGKLIYALAVLVFLAAFIQTAKAFDLFGCTFFTEYPLTLPVSADGEPAFHIQPVWLGTRFIYLAAGIILIVAGVCRSHKPRLYDTEQAV